MQDESPQLEIETNSLKLRPLCEDDEALYCDLYCDTETMRYIGPPMSRDRAARSFRTALRLTRRQPIEQLFFTILEKATQQSIGICGVQHFDARRNRIEAGIMIAAAWRARGFAKEGLSALVTQAFALFPIEEVRVQIAADHAVVERLVISVGFSPSGEAAAGGESPRQRIWSACRQAWRHNV